MNQETLINWYYIINIVCPIVTICIMIFAIFYTKDFILFKLDKKVNIIKSALNDTTKQSTITDLKLKQYIQIQRYFEAQHEYIKLEAGKSPHISSEYEERCKKGLQKTMKEANTKQREYEEELIKLGSPTWKEYKTIEEINKFMDDNSNI